MTGSAPPRITLVGGGSTHWTPRLLVDFLNTPSLADAAVTLVDIREHALAPAVELGSRLRERSGAGMTVVGTTDLDAGVDGADFVITQFSVGGFDSMRHDLEIPMRYGIRQPVGDSVGPGGITRALRSVPVLLGVARAMEQRAPSAMLVNVTNPLSALCRVVTRETSIRAVGLCNELVGLQFVLSLLLDCGLHEVDPTVAGVNHLPLVTSLRVGDDDGFARLRALLEDPTVRAEPIWMDPPEGMHYEKLSSGDRWTKGDVVANNPVKLELFRRFGVLPGSHDCHVVEFFPGFVHEATNFGREWRVHHYGLEGHQADKAEDDASFAGLLEEDTVPAMPSGELVAPLLDGLVGRTPLALPVNIPNAGQVETLPSDVVVECMGYVDDGELRARDQAGVPGIMGEYLRRIAFAEEATVDAACTGDRTRVLEAMLADPLAGRLPYEQVVTMTDELLAATAEWLPQF